MTRRRGRRGRRRMPPAPNTWTDVDRMRQYRGLLRHVPDDLDGTARRGIKPFARLERYDGRCRWCGIAFTPAEGRRAWHPPCVAAYWFATAQSSRLRRFLRKPMPCPCGQPGTELDHIDALGLASASGDRHRYLQALTGANLRWLCHACHARKSGRDRRQLNALHIQSKSQTNPRPGSNNG